MTARGVPPAPPTLCRHFCVAILCRHFVSPFFVSPFFVSPFSQKKKNFFFSSQKKKNFKKKKKIQNFFGGGGGGGGGRGPENIGPWDPPRPPLWTDTQSENITFARFAKRAVIMEKWSETWKNCAGNKYLTFCFLPNLLIYSFLKLEKKLLVWNLLKRSICIPGKISICSNKLF